MAKGYSRDATTADYIIRNGTFASGEVDDQEAAIVISLNKGELRENPIIGPNLVRMTKAAFDKDKIAREISLALRMDNKKAKKIEITKTGTINITLVK